MIGEAVRSVLVINVARIGDTILVTPAVRAIASAYPQARITCLAHPKRAEVLDHIPFVGQVGSISKARARFMGWIARARHDLAFVYGYDEALVRYALRVARRVVAFRQKDPQLNARLHRAVDPPPFQGRHSVLMHLALTDALAIPHAGHRLAYRVTDEEARWARDMIAARLPRASGPLIGLQIASFPTKGYRDWPVGHFAELCERILGRHARAHFLILGGALERERTEQLHARFAGCSTLFAGTLTLRRTAALMSCLDLYIGVDTGPTHIAGAMDFPMVVLYHAFSPSRLLEPLGHPCFFAVDHPRVGADQSASMAEIPVEAVWSRVAAALERASAPTSPAAEPTLM